MFQNTKHISLDLSTRRLVQDWNHQNRYLFSTMMWIIHCSLGIPGCYFTLVPSSLFESIESIESIYSYVK